MDGFQRYVLIECSLKQVDSVSILVVSDYDKFISDAQWDRKNLILSLGGLELKGSPHNSKSGVSL